MSIKYQLNIHCSILWSFITPGPSAGMPGVLSGFSKGYTESHFMHCSIQKYRRLGSWAALVYGWICN